MTSFGCLGDAQREGDVLRDRHVRVERIGLEDHGDPALGRRHLGHVDAADEDRAFGHHLEAGDHAQKRGLAAAGRAEQGAELAAVDRQVEILDRLDRPETLLDAAQFDFDHVPTLQPSAPTVAFSRRV